MSKEIARITVLEQGGVLVERDGIETWYQLDKKEEAPIFAAWLRRATMDALDGVSYEVRTTYGKNR